MYKFLLFGVFFVFIITSAKAQFDSYPNLILWLSADGSMDMNVNNVSSWNDMSRNGYKITQETETAQPLLMDSVLNNKPALYFDGGDYLSGGDILDLGTKSHTMFYIASSQNNNGTIFSKCVASNYQNRYALMFYSNNNYIYIHDIGVKQTSYSISLNTPFLCSFIKNNDANYFYTNHNGIYKTRCGIDGSYDFQSNFRFIVGGYNSNESNSSIYTQYNLKGYIFDILIYDTLLSDIQISEIENLLMDKYAPRLNLKDTIISYNFCPVTISAKNSGYKSYLWSTGATTNSIIATSPGEYWCEVTDIFDRTSRDTLTITLPELSVPNHAFCNGDTITVNSGFDGPYSFLWSNDSTTNSVKISDAGNYWVKVIDTLGCSKTDYFNVSVDNFPTEFSLGDSYSMCAGETYSIPYSEDSYTFNWSDGSTSNNFVVNTSNKYHLTITNQNNCVAKDSINISIKGIRPTAVFSHNSVCFGDSTSFANMSFTQSPDAINNVFWNFNDTDVSTENNTKHLFSSAGDFAVKLQIYSDSGCYADTTIDVHVFDVPKSNFSPLNTCNGKSIQFKDLSMATEGELSSWLWSFGDGEISYENNPSHIFEEAGIYNVKFSAIDLNGCTGSIIKQVNVRQTPVAEFEFEEACLGDKTYFKELTEMPSYASIIYRSWNFGDGFFSTLKTPEHIYSSNGTYQVSLINKSINGCSDTIVHDVTVHDYPKVAFMFDTICERNAAVFIDTSSINSESIVERKWDFGFETSFDSIATVIFPDSGLYEVSLTAKSSFGCESRKSEWITAHPLPNADFSIIPEYGIPPLNVQFINYSNGAENYQWTTENEFNSSEQNPNHTFNSEGIFNVSLIASSSFGCKDTTEASVYVIPSSLDIILTKLNVVDSNGYYFINVDFLNNGTKSIREFALDARLDDNTPIRETWSKYLKTGETASYRFSAAFVKSESKEFKSLCVDVKAIDDEQEDDTPQDNSLCFALLEDFYVVSAYPNPATTNLVVNIAMPNDGDLFVTLNSEDGKTLNQFTYNNIEQGTTRLQIDVNSLTSGIYILKFYFKDKEEEIIFMKE